MTKTIAVLIARVIFAGVFVMAAGFKFAGMSATAGYIAAAGFPMALTLAWIAAFFESALALALLTGAFFSQAAILAAVYVLSLFGFVIWVGLAISLLFFAGVKPPLVS